jgi:hypothetical protein
MNRNHTHYHDEAMNEGSDAARHQDRSTSQGQQGLGWMGGWMIEMGRWMDGWLMRCSGACPDPLHVQPTQPRLRIQVEVVEAVSCRLCAGIRQSLQLSIQETRVKIKALRVQGIRASSIPPSVPPSVSLRLPGLHQLCTCWLAIYCASIQTMLMPDEPCALKFA